MPPEGIPQDPTGRLHALLSEGIGDTIRVSLTLPNDRKHEEIDAGRKILADLAAGRPPQAGAMRRAG